jgi:hypothetical protein
MKKFIIFLSFLVCVTVVEAKGSHGGGHGYRGGHGGHVSVRGYMRRDGTYVQPHMRSAPDGTKLNNWSHSGNVNPYTGKVGTNNDYSPNYVGYRSGGYVYTTPAHTYQTQLPSHYVNSEHGELHNTKTAKDYD